MGQLNRYILEALQKAVTSAVTATGAPPVKYVNRNAPSGGKYWEVVYIPNDIDNEFWDAGKTYRGILRLILHWPQDDKGAYAALDEVDRVAKWFTVGKQMQDGGAEPKVTVRVTSEPSIASVIEESPELLIPLTIRYECFKI